MRRGLVVAILLLAVLVFVSCAGPVATPTGGPVATAVLSAGAVASPTAVVLTAVPTPVAATPVSPTSSPSTAVVAPTPSPGPETNLASAFCAGRGGTVEVRDEKGAKTGYCIFPGGSQCEEWAYYRGQCNPVVAEQTSKLLEEFRTTLPDLAFAGTGAFQLKVGTGQLALWVAYTYGLRNFKIDPLPSHVIALYTLEGDRWRSVARADLDQMSGKPAVAPDYVDERGISQVFIEPSRVFLEVSGGVGAHSGTYQLLSFDDVKLRFEVSAWAPSPGFGGPRDVNSDGLIDVVLDQSDPYVFCYACGVRKIGYSVWTWKEEYKQMREVRLEVMSDGTRSSQSIRLANNDAVALAGHGLWKDAMTAIAGAREAVQQEPDVGLVDWNYYLIKLHVDEMRESVTQDAYPLLANIFYGDYDSAVAMMRPYKPEQLFTTQSPLVVGTAAEPMVRQLSQAITETTTTVLKWKPDLAAAYFLRGWATCLAKPGSADAKTDVARAAELAPGEALFTRGRDYLSSR